MEIQKFNFDKKTAQYIEITTAGGNNAAIFSVAWLEASRKIAVQCAEWQGHEIDISDGMITTILFLMDSETFPVSVIDRNGTAFDATLENLEEIRKLIFSKRREIYQSCVEKIKRAKEE